MAAVALLPAAATAASRYVFEICDSVLPGGGVDGFVYGAHPRRLFSSENTCGQPGGALILRQNEIDPGDGGDADWAIPISLAAGRHASNRSRSRPRPAGRRKPRSGRWAGSSRRRVGRIQAAEQDVRSFRLVNDFEAFFIELQVRQLQPRRTSATPGPGSSAHYFATTVLDPVGADAREPNGSMLSDRRQARRARSIGVAGRGPRRRPLELLGLGQRPVQLPRRRLSTAMSPSTHNPSVTGTVAAQITPCPARARRNWTHRHRRLPVPRRSQQRPGLRLRLRHAERPEHDLHAAARRSVVDNSCTESAVAGGEVLSAQFERSNAEQVTVGYGKPATVTGRLANDAGDPIRGATLCVKMQTIGIEDRAASVGSALTDADGRYRYEVPPGPNREIVVGYRHDSVAGRPRRALLRPRPAEPARQRPAGPKRRSGPLLGRSCPGRGPRGRVVVLQAGTVGSKRWITFRKATTRPIAAPSSRASYRSTSTTPDGRAIASARSCQGSPSTVARRQPRSPRRSWSRPAGSIGRNALIAGRRATPAPVDSNSISEAAKEARDEDHQAEGPAPGKLTPFSASSP